MPTARRFRLRRSNGGASLRGDYQLKGIENPVVPPTPEGVDRFRFRKLAGGSALRQGDAVRGNKAPTHPGTSGPFILRHGTGGSALRSGPALRGSAPANIEIQSFDSASGDDSTTPVRSWSFGLWSQGTWSGFGTPGLQVFISTTDSASGIEQASSVIVAPTFVVTSDTGAGSELSTVENDMAAGDAATAVEQLSNVLYSPTDSDSSSSVDASQLLVLLPALGTTDLEPAQASDSSSLQVLISTTDSASGIDILSIERQQSDTGHGTDVSISTPTFALTDVGSGTEGTSSYTALIAASDANLTSTSAFVLDQNNQKSFFLEDVGFGVDVSSLSVTSPSGSDSGSGSDSSSLSPQLQANDTASGADSSALQAPTVSIEFGFGGDSSSLEADISASDASAVIFDESIVFYFVNIVDTTDFGLALDDGSVVASVIATPDTVVGTDELVDVKNAVDFARRSTESRPSGWRMRIRRVPED